jgi:hypothetical protein
LAEDSRVARCFHGYKKNHEKLSVSRNGELGVLLGRGIPYVRNADSSVDIPKHSLEKFVRQNARGIGKAEQAMVGENCADAK